MKETLAWCPFHRRTKRPPRYGLKANAVPDVPAKHADLFNGLDDDVVVVGLAGSKGRPCSSV